MTLKTEAMTTDQYIDKDANRLGQELFVERARQGADGITATSSAEMSR